MGYGTVQKPGDVYGPCAFDCHHIDCTALRQLVKSACRICGEVIGYETNFYREDEGAVHTVCRWKETEKGGEETNG